MLHLEIDVKRRHIYALVAAFAVIMTIMPLASYAADKFNDVPDSNTFHNDIAWLASAGVTKGCNPPANTEFCPGDAVTREQMAAFMHRLAVNKVVDAATADDASSLGGDAASTYQQWGDTLPAGETLTGTWGVSGGGFSADGITFSTELPGDIPLSDAHFLDSGEGFTADCPGPGMAEPGHLCVYEINDTSDISFSCFCHPEGGGSSVQSYGTVLFLGSTASKEWAYGSWAVTSTSGMTQLSTSALSGGDSDTPGG